MGNLDRAKARLTSATALNVEVLFVNFGGAWAAIEAPGVEPAFSGPNGKRKAIEYAKQRFGGSKGEVHVYDEFGLTIGDKFVIDGHGQYCPAES